MKKQFRSFEDAKKIIQKLGISGQKNWGDFCKSGKLPKNIPTNPRKIYKENWKGWGDWLGTGTVSTQLRKYWSFEKARDHVHKLNIKSQKEWNEYVKLRKLSAEIPSDPYKVYKNKGWISWGDWFGTGYVAHTLRTYLSFNEAKKFVHTLKIKTKDEWIFFTKSGNLPKNIPTTPARTYKEYWESWSDWLGSGTISHRNKSKMWLNWKEAKKLYQKIVKENGIKNGTEWHTYIKTHKLPKDLPRYPAEIYTKARVRTLMK